MLKSIAYSNHNPKVLNIGALRHEPNTPYINLAFHLDKYKDSIVISSLLKSFA